jgi:hypothetical protein
MEITKEQRQIIAHIYIRYRDARAHARKLVAELGVLSPAYIRAESRQDEIWNTLQAIKNGIYEPVRFDNPKQMLNLVKRKSALKEKNI